MRCSSRFEALGSSSRRGRPSANFFLLNLVVSLGVVALLVPATILGLSIRPAVMVHEGSTVAVVFNAPRLLAYRDNPGVA